MVRIYNHAKNMEKLTMANPKQKKNNISTSDQIEKAIPQQKIANIGECVMGFILVMIGEYKRPDAISRMVSDIYGISVKASTIEAIMHADEYKDAIAARRASYNENSKESAGFSRRWVADQLVDALNIAREAGDARGMAIVADKLANITGIASPHSIEISHNQTQNVSISHDRTLTIAPMPMPIDYLKDAEALILDVEDKRKITSKAPAIEA